MGALALQGWEWELLRFVLPPQERVLVWKSGRGGASLGIHSRVVLLCYSSFFSAAEPILPCFLPPFPNTL